MLLPRHQFYDYRLQWLAKSARDYAGSANVDVWGTFIDNHDNPRFLNSFINDANEKYKIPLLHNALTWLMLHRGIPIVYYGTEQQYAAGPVNQRTLKDNGDNCRLNTSRCDSAWREPLWYSNYNPTAETFRLLANLNKARKAAQVRNDWDMHSHSGWMVPLIWGCLEQHCCTVLRSPKHCCTHTLYAP